MNHSRKEWIHTRRMTTRRDDLSVLSGQLKNLLERLVLQRITCSPISQNHRVVQVRRDHWRWSCPNPLLKQGHLELVAQCHVKRAFERVQGWRLHNLSGQPLPLLGDPHWKKVFPDVQTEPPVLQVVPIASRLDFWICIALSQCVDFLLFCFEMVVEFSSSTWIW